MVVLFLHYQFADYILVGPFSNPENKCENMWIYNLLYVSNIFGLSKEVLVCFWLIRSFK